MVQTRVSNLVLFMGLTLVLVMHPLEAFAGNRVDQCAALLRNARQNARKVILGVGGTAVGLLAGSQAYFAIGGFLNSRAAKQVAASSSANVAGAHYALDWMTLGQLTPVGAQTTLADYTISLEDNYGPIQKRIELYRNLNLWTPDQVAIAYQALAHFKARPWKKMELSGVSLFSELSVDPMFKKMVDELPTENKFTIALLTEPIITIDGHSDAYWLSVFFAWYRHQGTYTDDQLAALQSIQKLNAANDPDFTLAMLTTMVAQSLTDSDGLAEKKARARDLKIDQSFIYRADIPTFSGPLVYRDADGEQVLNGELDRWSVILQNPYFANIREAWQNGSISDMKALNQADALIRGRSQIFKIYGGLIQNKKLSPLNACRVLYGDLEYGANPIFSSIRRLTQSVDLRLYLAQIRYSAVLNSAEFTNASDVSRVMAIAHQAEEDTLQAEREGSLKLPHTASCEELEAAEAAPQPVVTRGRSRL